MKQPALPLRFTDDHKAEVAREIDAAWEQYLTLKRDQGAYWYSRSHRLLQRVSRLQELQKDMR